MEVYAKDNSGDQASPINGQISGLSLLLYANYVVENLNLLQTTTQRHVTIWSICV